MCTYLALPFRYDRFSEFSGHCYMVRSMTGFGHVEEISSVLASSYV